jgi:hypothetical protein
MIRTLSGAAASLAAAVLVVLTVAPASAGTPDAKLLAKFQPVTRFDPAESFTPTSVQTFITDSSLERYDGTDWVAVDQHPGPGGLPGPGTGTWRLNQHPCTPSTGLGGLDCYADSWSRGAGSSVVYGRVTRESGKTVLQYWYFYYDDLYSYFYPPSDVLWQAHEGDWEVVNVVLSADEQPEFVGYSQHCLGQQRPWATTPKWGDTHPVVYVAVGSHANYFGLGTHQLNLACIPAQVQFVLFFVLNLPPPVDYTGDGAVAGPPRSGGTLTHVEQIDSGAHSWVAFPGFWGEDEFFHAPVIGTVQGGTAPQGPAYHAVWADPLGTLATWPTG